MLAAPAAFSCWSVRGSRLYQLLLCHAPLPQLQARNTCKHMLQCGTACNGCLYFIGTASMVLYCRLMLLYTMAVRRACITVLLASVPYMYTQLRSVLTCWLCSHNSQLLSTECSRCIACCLPCPARCHFALQLSLTKHSPTFAVALCFFRLYCRPHV
jgi:hypothetical protein